MFFLDGKFRKKTMAEIWKIEDPSEFICALIPYIVDKCDAGDEMDKLSAPERAFYVALLLMGEVDNGGFSQFFFNYSGDCANEVVAAFTEIGAIPVAEICKKAVSVYGDSVPADRAERESLLVENDEVDNILEECDNAFYAYGDKLEEQVFQYVLKNKAFFT